MAIKREEWENRYEQIKNMPEVLTNERLEEELKGKEVQFAQRLAQIKDTSSQEYREVISERNAVRRDYENSMKENEFIIENFTAIRNNLSLIEKARENRNTYQEILDEILESKIENERKIEERARLGEEAKRLEAELEELKYHEEHLLIAINNPEATPEQREQVASRLEDIRRKLSKNHLDFSANQMALEEQLKSPLIDIVDGDIEELQSKIDRCNRTCELLLEGKSMGQVQAVLGETKSRKARGQQTVEQKEPVQPVEPKKPEVEKTVKPEPAPKATEPVKPAQEEKTEPKQEAKPQEPVKKEEEKPQQEETAQSKYEISEEKVNRLKTAIAEMRSLGISDESIRSYIFAKDTGVIHSEEELKKLHEVGEKHGVYDIMAEDWLTDNGSNGYSREMYNLVAGILGNATLEKELQEKKQDTDKPKTEEAKKTITIDEVANRIFKILNAEDKKSIVENKYTFVNRLQDGHENWYNYMIKLPYNVLKKVEDKVYELCEKEQTQEKQPPMPPLETSPEKAKTEQKTPQPVPTPKKQIPDKMPPLKSDKSNKLLPEQIRGASIFVGKDGSAMDVNTVEKQDKIKREYTPLTKVLEYNHEDGISPDYIEKVRKIADPIVIREILFANKLSAQAKKGLIHYYMKMIELREKDPEANIEKYARVLNLQYDLKGLRKSGLSKEDQRKVLKHAKKAHDLGIAHVEKGFWIAAKWKIEDWAESIGVKEWDDDAALPEPEEQLKLPKPITAERKSKKNMDEKYKIDNSKNAVMDAEYEPVEEKRKKANVAVVEGETTEIEDEEQEV